MYFHLSRGQGENKALKEQVRQKEEQLQAAQQQSTLLAAELRDASTARDRTMSELYHMKLETDALRKAKTDAQAQCARLERLVEQMKAEEAKQEVTEEELQSMDCISAFYESEEEMRLGFFFYFATLHIISKLLKIQQGNTKTMKSFRI